MFHVPARISVEGLFALTRTSEASTMFRAICLYVTSWEGYLTANGYALRGANDEFPFVHPMSGAGTVRIIEEQSDIALAHIGIAMVRVEPGPQVRLDMSRSAIAVVTARLGLLARALGRAFQHLERRQSFGQKTLPSIGENPACLRKRPDCPAS